VILTESEARAKWCPFARVMDCGKQTAVTSVNRGHDMGEWTMCIGARCMAWRQALPQELTVNKGRGYCGLAGRP
jgi:hypothetical protein